MKDPRMPDPGARTLGQLFDRTAARRAGEPFLIFEGTTYTYAQAHEAVDAIARGLLACGFSRGDHIALWMSNSPEWVFVQQAVLRIGGVLVVLNTHSVGRELFYMLRQSDASGIVFEERVFGHRFVDLLGQMAHAGDAPLSWGHVKELFPQMRVMIGEGGDLPGFALGLDGVIARGREVDDRMLADAADGVRGSDAAMLLYTSGTTGAPKGVLLRHEAVLARCAVFSQWFGLTGRDVEFYAQPLYHLGGCISAIENSIYTGGCVCCRKRFEALACLRDIEKHRCTMFYCVPTVLADVLHHPDFDRFDLSSMRVGIVSGAPAPPALVEEAKARFIPQLVAAYGSTECTSIVTATRLDDSAHTAATRVGTPTPFNDVRIFDLETGAELPRGAEGEICVRSPYNMAGYYRDEQATRAAIDEAGFLHTGDIGFFDERGYLSLTGRMNDTVIVGGVNVYPAEVEAVLDAHPGIESSQVVGTPDERLGEVPFAFVVLRPGSDALDAGELYRYCRSQLSSFKVPRYVRCVDAFPLNSVGKPVKKELRKLADPSAGCLKLF